MDFGLRIHWVVSFSSTARIFFSQVSSRGFRGAGSGRGVLDLGGLLVILLVVLSLLTTGPGAEPDMVSR